jgi:transglutaminase-like putative cysteine protease
MSGLRRRAKDCLAARRVVREELAMFIRIGYEIAISCQQETAMNSFLMVCPERQSDIVAEHGPVTSPTVHQQAFRDIYGNLCLRMLAPAGDFKLTYDAVVADSGLADPVDLSAKEVAVDKLPSECLPFLLGSRYCETDHLSGLAWRLFGDLEPGWGRVQAICDYVHERLTFSYGYARATRTACQAHDERTGVCRDFAHLAVALCRCLNIPARYVNGYMGDIGVPEDPAPMDFNAWFEVFLGDRWQTFDARHNSRRIGRIVVARGRDAADIPLIHTFGPHMLQTFNVWTYEQKAPALERGHGSREVSLVRPWFSPHWANHSRDTLRLS